MSITKISKTQYDFWLTYFVVRGQFLLGVGLGKDAYSIGKLKAIYYGSLEAIILALRYLLKIEFLFTEVWSTDFWRYLSCNIFFNMPAIGCRLLQFSVSSKWMLVACIVFIEMIIFGNLKRCVRDIITYCHFPLLIGTENESSYTAHHV